MSPYLAHPGYYPMKPMPHAASPYPAYFSAPHHPPPHPVLAGYSKVGGLMEECGRVGWNPNHRLSPSSVLPSYRPAWDMDTLKASIRCCQAGCGEVRAGPLGFISVLLRGWGGREDHQQQ